MKQKIIFSTDAEYHTAMASLENILSNFQKMLPCYIRQDFNKIHDKIIQKILISYHDKFINMTPDFKSDVYILIAAQSYDISQETKNKTTKTNLDTIRTIAIDALKQLL